MIVNIIEVIISRKHYPGNSDTCRKFQIPCATMHRGIHQQDCGNMDTIPYQLPTLFRGTAFQLQSSFPVTCHPSASFHFSLCEKGPG